MKLSRGLTGLLHDIGYDYVGRDMARHGLEALNVLSNSGLPREVLEAIAGHNEHNGFKVVDEKALKILHGLMSLDLL